MLFVFIVIIVEIDLQKQTRFELMFRCLLQSKSISFNKILILLLLLFFICYYLYARQISKGIIIVITCIIRQNRKQQYSKKLWLFRFPFKEKKCYISQKQRIEFELCYTIKLVIKGTSYRVEQDNSLYSNQLNEATTQQLIRLVQLNSNDDQIIKIEDAVYTIKERWARFILKEEQFVNTIYQLRGKISQLYKEIANNNQKFTNQLKSFITDRQSRESVHRIQIDNIQQNHKKYIDQIKYQLTMKISDLQEKQRIIGRLTNIISQMQYQNQLNQQSNKQTIKKFQLEYLKNLQEFQQVKDTIKNDHQKQISSTIIKIKEEIQRANEEKYSSYIKIINQYQLKQQNYKILLQEKNNRITNFIDEINKLIDQNFKNKQEQLKQKNNAEKLRNQKKELERNIERLLARILELQNKIYDLQLTLNQQQKQTKNNQQKLYTQNLELLQKIDQLSQQLEKIHQKYSQQNFHKKNSENIQLVRQKQKNQSLQNRIIYLQTQYQSQIKNMLQQQQAIRIDGEKIKNQLRMEKENRLSECEDFKKEIYKITYQFRKKIEDQQQKYKTIIFKLELKQKQFEQIQKQRFFQYEQSLMKQQESLKSKTQQLQQSMILFKSQKQELVNSLVSKHQNQINQLKQQHLKNLHAQKYQLQAKYNYIIVQNTKQYETKQKILKQQFEKTLQNTRIKIMNQNKSKLSQIYESFQKQKQRLKNNYEKNQQQLIQKYKIQIQELKGKKVIENLQQKFKTEREILIRQHQNQIIKIKSHNQNKKNALIAENLSKIKRLQTNYENQIIKLIKVVNIDRNKVNDKSISEKQQLKVRKMTKQQKIRYLNDSIIELISGFAELQNKIKILEKQLINKNILIHEIEQSSQIKINEVQKELNLVKTMFDVNLNEKLKEKNHDYLNKLHEKQQEFSRISNQLQKEFSELKKLNNKLLDHQKQKINQLQNLLLTRPSRLEDITVINELLEDKVNMNKALDQQSKKINKANQVVKYLQMEIENYKQIYDIFGPKQIAQVSSDKIKIPPEIKSLLYQNSEKIKIKSKHIKTEDRQQFSINKSDIELNLLPPLRFNTIESKRYKQQVGEYIQKRKSFTKKDLLFNPKYPSEFYLVNNQSLNDKQDGSLDMKGKDSCKKFKKNNIL